MWYFVLNEWLPPVSDALNPLPGIYLSKSGMSFPVPEWEHGHLVTVAGFALGIAARLGVPALGAQCLRAHGNRAPDGLARVSHRCRSARCWDGWRAARRRRWNCRCAATSTSPAAAPSP